MGKQSLDPVQVLKRLQVRQSFMLDVKRAEVVQKVIDIMVDVTQAIIKELDDATRAILVRHCGEPPQGIREIARATNESVYKIEALLRTVTQRIEENITKQIQKDL